MVPQEAPWGQGLDTAVAGLGPSTLGWFLQSGGQWGPLAHVLVRFPPA